MKPLRLNTILEALDSKNTLSSDQIEKEKGELDRAGLKTSDAQKGRGARLNTLKGVENTDAEDMTSLKSWVQMQKNNKEEGLGKKKAREARRRVYNQVKSNTDEPSIIAKKKDGTRELVAGNTRASLRRVLGKPVKAHVFKER